MPLPLARRRCASKNEAEVFRDRENGALDAGQPSHQKIPTGAQLKRPTQSLCFNCGLPGHNLQCCPQPRDNNAINKRRKEWESERGGRPSWMNEPRYFVFPSENKVAHVNAGLLSSELCSALGITSSHLMPPPYLANMIREGYPPGFVGIVGIDGEPAQMDREEDTLRFICGGQEMDLSEEDLENGESGKSGIRPIAHHKAAMTVVFPGAFGAPPPPGVDASLWDFTRRVPCSHMHFPQAQVQAQEQLQQAQQPVWQHEMRYTPVAHPQQPQQREYGASEHYGGGGHCSGGHCSNANGAVNFSGYDIGRGFAARPLPPLETQRISSGSVSVNAGRGFVNSSGCVKGNAGNNCGGVYDPFHAADYRASTAVHYGGYLPPHCGGGWASNSLCNSSQAQLAARNSQQQSQNLDNYHQQYRNYNQATQLWHRNNSNGSDTAPW